MQKIIIDRFEGHYAVCEKEDKTMINIEKNRLPKQANTGDVLLIADNGAISLDNKETEDRKKRIENIMEDIWAD